MAHVAAAPRRKGRDWTHRCSCPCIANSQLSVGTLTLRAVITVLQASHASWEVPGSIFGSFWLTADRHETCNKRASNVSNLPNFWYAINVAPLTGNLSADPHHFPGDQLDACRVCPCHVFQYRPRFVCFRLIASTPAPRHGYSLRPTACSPQDMPLPSVTGTHRRHCAPSVATVSGTPNHRTALEEQRRIEKGGLKEPWLVIPLRTAEDQGLLGDPAIISSNYGSTSYLLTCCQKPTPNGEGSTPKGPTQEPSPQP